MDKQPKNRITITFNGKEQSHTIQDKSKEDNEKKENDDEEFPWVLPEHDENEDMYETQSPQFTTPKKKKSNLTFPLFMKKRRRNKKRRPQYKMTGLWISFLSAVCIGILLGTVVLTFFADKEVIKQANNDASMMGMATTEHSAEQAPTHNEDNETEATAPIANEELTLPSLSVYVVQAGVFSNQDSASTALNNMKMLGYPGQIIENGQLMLFIGAGPTKELASELGDVYENIEEGVYVKKYDIEGTKLVDANIGSYIMKGMEIYKQMLEYSGAVAVENRAYTTAELDQIASLMEEWESLQPNTEMDETEIGFVNVIKNVSKLIQENDPSVHWEVQQYLLDGLVAYEEMQK